MGKRWLATFNAAKNQFVLVAYHASDVEMYESMLEEKVFFFYDVGFQGFSVGVWSVGDSPSHWLEGRFSKL